MKKILVTQRVDYVNSHKEYRDALDQRIIHWLLSANLYPVMVPNNRAYVKYLLEKEGSNGLLLTGGGDLVSCGGNCLERDAIEELLLSHFIRLKKPVLGICRGMQLILQHHYVNLVRTPDHVAQNHALIVHGDSAFSSMLKKVGSVDTYHQFGVFESSSPMLCAASANDGVVMAIEHEQLPIFGVMWHPERMIKNHVNIELLNTVFNG